MDVLIKHHVEYLKYIQPSFVNKNVKKQNCLKLIYLLNEEV